MPELIDRLPFEAQVLSSGEIQISDRTFTASEIVSGLEAFLTDERKSRISQVIDHRTLNVATVVEHLYDVGNISAVMRSAESFGFLPFHIIERPGAKYKISDRISKGTEKWLDIHKYKETEKCFLDLKKSGYQIYASDLSATCALHEIPVQNKVAIVFGNEKEGISDVAKKMADGTFIIPMHGFAQSFNISVAAAISFSAIHQKRLTAGFAGDMSGEEKLRLRASYYLRTLDSAADILLKR